jgi:hypothetical protein
MQKRKSDSPHSVGQPIPSSPTVKSRDALSPAVRDLADLLAEIAVLQLEFTKEPSKRGGK